jgi:hypothetical protein
MGLALGRQVRDMSATGEFVQRLRRLWKERIDDPMTSGPTRTPCAFSSHVVAGLSDKFVPESTSLDPFPFIPGEQETSSNRLVKVFMGILPSGPLLPPGPPDIATPGIPAQPRLHRR